MPSRRCPHCKVESSYSTVGSTYIFDPHKPSNIRLDVCQNDECHGHVAVIMHPPTGSELDVFPKLETDPDELLPDEVKKAFGQALKSLNEKIWDGCVLMCRRALEETTADLGAKGKVLYDKIEDLAKQNRITPDLQEWAHEGRLAGKLGAHGTEEEAKKWNDESDAEEIVEFCKWFFRYVYVLPLQLQQRKERLAEEAKRRSAEESAPAEEG